MKRFSLDKAYDDAIRTGYGDVKAREFARKVAICMTYEEREDMYNEYSVTFFTKLKTQSPPE